MAAAAAVAAAAVASTQTEYKNLLAGACGDFIHDFGSVKFKYALDKLAASYDSKIVGNKTNYKRAVLQERKNLEGKSVGSEIFNHVYQSLPNGIPVVNKLSLKSDSFYNDEDKTFNILANSNAFEGVKNQIGLYIEKTILNGNTLAQILSNPDVNYRAQAIISMPEIPVSSEPITVGAHAYKISAVLVSNGHDENKITRFLPECFRLASGNNKFCLIYDASFFSFNDFNNPSLNRTLLSTKLGQSVTGLETHFMFIDNIENKSDPASKLSDIKSHPGHSAELITESSTSQESTYIPFNINNISSNNCFFSSLRINLAESEYGINANITFPSGRVEEIIDLKTTSVPENLTVKYLQSKLLGYSDVNSELASYFELKRAGDWCQVLSLLDLDRKYQTSTGIKTLGQIKREGYEVSLLTHDRIALAYALNKGVNVFFSMKTPYGLFMIYYKNTAELNPQSLALITQTKLLRAVEKLNVILVQNGLNLEQLKQLILLQQEYKNSILKKISTITLSLGYENFLILLRNYLYGLNNIKAYPRESLERINDLLSKYNSNINEINFLIGKQDDIDELDNLVDKVISIITDNKRIFDALNIGNIIINTNEWEQELYSIREVQKELSKGKIIFSSRTKKILSQFYLAVKNYTLVKLETDAKINLPTEILKSVYGNIILAKDQFNKYTLIYDDLLRTFSYDDGGQVGGGLSSVRDIDEFIITNVLNNVINISPTILSIQDITDESAVSAAPTAPTAPTADYEIEPGMFFNTVSDTSLVIDTFIINRDNSINFFWDNLDRLDIFFAYKGYNLLQYYLIPLRFLIRCIERSLEKLNEIEWQNGNKLYIIKELDDIEQNKCNEIINWITLSELYLLNEIDGLKALFIYQKNTVEKPIIMAQLTPYITNYLGFDENNLRNSLIKILIKLIFVYYGKCYESVNKNFSDEFYIKLINNLLYSQNYAPIDYIKDINEIIHIHPYVNTYNKLNNAIQLHSILDMFDGNITYEDIYKNIINIQPVSLDTQLNNLSYLIKTIIFDYKYNDKVFKLYNLLEYIIRDDSLLVNTHNLLSSMPLNLENQQQYINIGLLYLFLFVFKYKNFESISSKVGELCSKIIHIYSMLPYEYCSSLVKFFYLLRQKIIERIDLLNKAFALPQYTNKTSIQLEFNEKNKFKEICDNYLRITNHIFLNCELDNNIKKQILTNMKFSEEEIQDLYQIERISGLCAPVASASAAYGGFKKTRKNCNARRTKKQKGKSRKYKSHKSKYYKVRKIRTTK